MQQHSHFDVLVVGGSYAGLSAAMALGRSLRKVLIVDSGLPCNRQTPHSHNFLTQDGVPPAQIAALALKQVLRYNSVEHLRDRVVTVSQQDKGFSATTAEGRRMSAGRVLFATGVKDIMPATPGFAECWGISALHCPYCHGYEVRNRKTGILANGETAYELCRLLQHWTDQLTLFTDGPAAMSEEQRAMTGALNIPIVEKNIEELQQQAGRISAIRFKDGSCEDLEVLYARVPFEQHCPIPAQIGCAMTEQGHIEVDFLQKATVEGVFAAGDNTTPFRTVSLAVSGGTVAGAAINKELIEEELAGKTGA